MKQPKITVFLLLGLCYACSTNTYTIRNIKGSYAVMDSAYNNCTNRQAIDLFNYYSAITTPVVSEKIGEASATMTIDKPAYELVYFTLDVMKQYGNENRQGGVDLALMNIRGHRSNLHKGEITLGDMFEIYNFDNALVYVDVKGKDLLEIIKLAAGKDPKVLPSKNVSYTIINHKVKNVFINGLPLNLKKKYKVITLDYLADGNDGMTVLKNSSHRDNSGVYLRDMMISYVKNNQKIAR